MNPKAFGRPLQFHCPLAPAGREKPAFDGLARLAHDLVVTRLTAHLNRSLRYCHHRGIAAATRSLTVPTVTVQHDDWVSVALVMDSAPGAASRQFPCHRASPTGRLNLVSIPPSQPIDLCKNITVRGCRTTWVPSG